MRKNLTNFCFGGATVILLMMIALFWVAVMSPPVTTNATTLTGNASIDEFTNSITAVANHTNNNVNATADNTCLMNSIGADGKTALAATITANGNDKDATSRTAVINNSVTLKDTPKTLTAQIFGNALNQSEMIDTATNDPELATLGLRMQASSVNSGEKISMTVATGTYFLSSTIAVMDRRSGSAETAYLEGVTPVIIRGAMLKTVINNAAAIAEYYGKAEIGYFATSTRPIEPCIRT